MMLSLLLSPFPFVFHLLILLNYQASGLLATRASVDKRLHLVRTCHNLHVNCVIFSQHHARNCHFQTNYFTLYASKIGNDGDDGGGISKNNEGESKRRGYRFGDITKSLIGNRVSKITGKPYEFGDLSRSIDSSIKGKISQLTGKDDYEFGDLSRWVDTQIKGEVNKFTNKESYQFGDLTKEIVKRVLSGQYTLDDLFLLLKALALVEASISPVAGFMPVKLLIELLNFSIANDVAGRVSSALAMELDRRLKKSLLGDENYQLGDATKRTISNAVKMYTGKESYTFGDVTKKVVSNFSQDGEKGNRSLIGTKSTNELEPGIIDALNKWDSLNQKELNDNLAGLEKFVNELDQEKGRNDKTTNVVPPPTHS